MDIEVEIVLEWSLFPDAFLDRFEEEILRTDPAIGGILVEVEASYDPGAPGRLTGHPDSMYPPEPHSVELLATIITVPFVNRELELGADKTFISICRSFATDWLEIEEARVESNLVTIGAMQCREEALDAKLALILFEGDGDGYLN